MNKRVLAPHTLHAEREVLDSRPSSLPVNQIAVRERVLEQRHDSVHVILRHLADVLKNERERLENAILNVEFLNSVLVHERRQNVERPAGFSNDSDGDSRAHSQLPLLHLQVIEQRDKDVLRTDSLRDVPKRVDCRSSNTLLVRLQQV